MQREGRREKGEGEGEQRTLDVVREAPLHELVGLQRALVVPAASVAGRDRERPAGRLRPANSDQRTLYFPFLTVLTYSLTYGACMCLWFLYQVGILS